MVLCSLLFKGYHQHHNYVVFLFVPINFMVRLSCLCLTNENQINYYDGIEERISDDHIRSFFVFFFGVMICPFLSNKICSFYRRFNCKNIIFLKVTPEKQNPQGNFFDDVQ